MYCKNCGALLESGAMFCGNCGSKIPSAPASEQVVQKTAPAASKRTREFIVAGIICVVFVAGILLYLFLGSGNTEDEKRSQQAKTSAMPTELKFDHEKYALSVKCAEDMSTYLQCTNIDKKDVTWSAESNQVQVGQNGMVAIQDYNVVSKLTAVSKKDRSVVATCQVSSLSEKEDFQNKVMDYNQIRTKNEEQQDGTMAVYNKNNVESKIYVYRENTSAGVRKSSYQWDQKLFYRLEEVEGRKDGGEINDYRVARKQFINGDSGNVMEYEIYQQPRTNSINKIVAIEHMDSTLEVTEYYYTKKGKVNFVFQYRTENYLPSYANPDIHGQRFLYDHDTMVTWRIVEGRNKITNYCANKTEKRRLAGGGWSNVKEYAKLSDSRKKKYNALEKKMLNAAYNTLHKIKEYEGISTIRGQVNDGEDAPLSDVGVSLYSDTYDCEVYSGVTNSAGYYEIFVPSRKGTYEMTYTMEEDDKKVEEKMYHIDLDQDDLGVDQEIIHMVNEDAERSYDVRLYDATKNSEDSASQIAGARLVFRKGVNNYDGEEMASARTDADGCSSVDLVPGMYTVEAVRNGYMQEYRNIFFEANESTEIPILLTPKLGKDEVRIVLTWADTPPDEDSHLFTPDGEHVCYYEKDGVGANLDVDDTDGYGPETVTITDLAQGVYKYYVADFTHCSANEVKSTAMSESNAVVRVYTYRGLERTFQVPKNQQGVIWEVFSIRNGEIVPAQRYYDSIEDKQWCTSKYY